MHFPTATVAGGTYFFTVDLDDRRSGLLIEHAYDLRTSVRLIRALHPFDVHAWVMLPDHLHAVWTLPDDDRDAAMRWSLIKTRFAEHVDTVGGAIWQRRYRERRIHDDAALRRHVHDVHANPVKHGYVARAIDWPYSSIHRHIREGALDVET